MVAPVAKGQLIENDDNTLVGFDRLNCIRSKIPSVTHVDGSARVQTVCKRNNRCLGSHAGVIHIYMHSVCIYAKLYIYIYIYSILFLFDILIF